MKLSGPNKENQKVLKQSDRSFPSPANKDRWIKAVWGAFYMGFMTIEERDSCLKSGSMSEDVYNTVTVRIKLLGIDRIGIN